MFAPRNIEKRQEDLKRIKEKETRVLNELAVQLSEVVKGFRDTKVKDKREQLFIDKFVDCQIKTEHSINRIFFIDQNENYLADYDSKNQDFWISDSQIWSILESKYSLNYEQIKQLTMAWVEEHFRFRPNTSERSAFMNWSRWKSTSDLDQIHHTLN